MTVVQNVAYGLMVKKVGKARAAARARRGARDACGSTASASRRPSQLSGGQRQRVALARALVNRAQGAAARRAARRPRPQAARADAGRAQGDPARRRHHVPVRDPRPGGGADDERPDRGLQQRAHRAGRHRPRRSTSDRRRRSSPASSARRTCCRVEAARSCSARTALFRCGPRRSGVAASGDGSRGVAGRTARSARRDGVREVRLRRRGHRATSYDLEPGGDARRGPAERDRQAHADQSDRRRRPSASGTPARATGVAHGACLHEVEEHG